MKHVFFYLLFLIPAMAVGQAVVLNEDFEDGDFTVNPAWTGDNDLFTVFDELGNNQLRLDDQDVINSTSFLTTESTAAYGSWEFFIDQDFEPSNSNRSFIFLSSDIEDLAGDVNGYAIRTGEGGSDDRFRLFRFINGNATEILTGTIDVSAGGPFQIKVTRSEDGTWELFESAGYGSDPVSAGTAMDNTHTTSGYFGFQLEYTATRKQHFFFDDIIIENSEEFELISATGSSNNSVDVSFNYAIDEATVDASDFTISGLGAPAETELTDSDYKVRLTFGQEIPDDDYTVTVSGIENIFGVEIESNSVADFAFSNPFELLSASSPDGSQVVLVFNEAVDFSTVESSDILYNGSINPVNESQPSPEELLLEFSDPLPTGQVEISVEDIKSNSGWTIPENTAFEFVMFDEYQEGDIVINEFLKDPPAGAEEYVELKNTSGRYLNLKNWQLGDNGNITVITNNDLAILPDSFVVITKDTASNINFFGSSSYVQASLPAFNNGDDQVRLFDQSGAIADSLEYNSAWGGVKVAIERRDYTVSAEYKENWGDSPAADFGTPGYTNQIEADEAAPSILNLIVEGDQTLKVAFSERLESSQAQTIGNYTLSQNPEEGITTPVLPEINSVQQIAPDTIEVSLDAALEEYKGTWNLEVENIIDIFGNSADDEIEFNYYIIFTAEPGQVVINEFMYDPASDYSEFVELYNHSDSTFDLKDWTLNDNTGNRRTLTGDSYVLPSGSFIVLVPDNSITLAYPETQVIEMGSRFPALNNNFDDIVIRNQNGIRVDSLSYSSDWGGKEISLERRNVEISSAFRENWDDSPSDNFATPGLPNEIDDDNSPPEIDTYQLLNDSTVQIIFTERIHGEEVINPDNYAVNIPVSDKSFKVAENDQIRIEYLEPDTLNLTYKPGFYSSVVGSFYQIEILNQTDIFGNQNLSLQLEIERITVDFAEAGDVVINEFMYDPVGTYSEFIELANYTDSNFDLKNWTLSDNTGNERTITNSTYLLRPNIPDQVTGDVYVVLAPDSSLVNLFPNIPIIVMGNSFPALNNNTDAIVIRNEAGVVIDSLTYTSDWGGDEVSLERRIADGPSVYKENWGDSPSTDFATPGKRNLVEPDEDPPQIIDAFITSPDSIRLIFDESLDSTLAVEQGNYSISPEIMISDVIYENTEVDLILNSSLNDGEFYTVTAENQEDVFGNKLNSVSVEVEFVAFTEAVYGDVIINEILYRRESADSPEFVELFNNSSNNYDITDWIFSDQGSSATIPAGKNIRSGEYLILTDHEEFANSLDHAIYLSNFPSLNDAGDAVVIKDQNGLVIDSLFYESTWGNHLPGVSLERKDPDAASNDASNWASNTTDPGNSSGSESSIYETDETPPEIIFAKLQPDNNIFVAFSEFINVESASISITEKKGVIAGFNKANANIVLLEGVEFDEEEKLTVNFQNITDIKGNANESTSIEVARPLSTGNIVINEILFDPLANSDDNLPDQTEYIELYNRANYAVSLEGFFLHDEPDENREVRSIAPLTSHYKWIPPKSYTLVYADNEAANYAESQLANYFENEDQDEQFSILIKRSGLSLASSGDAIYLADSTGTTIDSVFYDESWQNPNLHSTKGIALERIDPDGQGNDKSNWSSSIDISGGTPGIENSIFQQAGAGPLETGINFTPNPFSPDDDGYDDNLFINYKLDESDYLLRIRIFDRYGREVRKLTDGRAAGFEGSVIWDGFTDDRRKNRVGIYIILFEAYNSAQGKNITFKETVVLARKF